MNTVVKWGTLVATPLIVTAIWYVVDLEIKREIRVGMLEDQVKKTSVNSAQNQTVACAEFALKTLKDEEANEKWNVFPDRDIRSRMEEIGCVDKPR